MVSIIICCYNGAHFIERCFRSIMAQSYKKIQILFVDDGSIDNSFQEALKYQQKLNSLGIELVLLQQKNQGAGYAAAYALKHAQGDFIMCLDIDDYIYPDAIESMVSFLKSHLDYAVVRTNGYRIGTFNDLSTAILFTQNEKEKTNQYIFEDLMLGKTFNWAGAYMVRSSVLWESYPDHNMLTSRYGQNLQILAVAAYQNKSGFIDRPLMQYITNNSSFTNRDKSFERQLNLFDNFEQIRVDILDFLQIKDEVLRHKMTNMYLHIRMNLCINFQRKSSYLEYYKKLEQNNGLTIEDRLSKAVIEHKIMERLFYALLLRVKKIVL